MNMQMMNELTSDRIRDITRQAARSRGPAGQPATSPAAARPHRPRLRSRVGFTLIEAGLRLLATSPGTQPQRQS